MDIYLTRNRTILEYRENEEMWTGAFMTVLKVKSFFGLRKKLCIMDDYKDSIADDLGYAIEEYELDASSHYEDKDESEAVLENADKIVWID